MKIKKILFRADSSSDIGTGHIMRDLVLAEQYSDAEISFAVQDLKGNMNHKIREKGYKIIILKSNNVNELVTIVQQYLIDLIIIDHYQIDYDFEKTLKERTNVKLQVFDGSYKKHHCDILLNANIYAEKERYKGLVPNKCELRCGENFILLREEFSLIKERAVQVTPENILIAMGGADTQHLNLEILDVLSCFSNLRVIIVSTSANAHLDELKKYTELKDWIELHVDTSQIANLMTRSYFCIVTPSVTIHEVLFMRVPFVAIKTADNQQYMFDYLKDKDFLVLEKFSRNELIKKIKRGLKGVANVST